MPRVDISIRDVEPSIIRPVAFSVLRDLLKYTGLAANTNILFPGGQTVGYQPDTTLSAKIEGREKNLLAHDKRVFIELDEDYDEDSAITGAIMKPENRFIFADPEIDSYIKPNYSTVHATLSVRYRAKDRIEALRWRDLVRSRIQLGRRELLHHISYSYLIPKPILVLLAELHRLRENVMGFGEDFITYKDSHFTKRKTTVTTLKGTEPREAISELERRIIGSFDFGLRPERAERDGNGDAWVASFTYRYTYERPISFTMFYPLVVHNQLLSPQYRVDAPSDRDNFHALSHTMSTRALQYFEPDRLIDLWKNTRGIYLPNFDDFVPRSVLLHSLRVFTGLVLIDVDQPEILMNFQDMGDYKFDPIIEDFLRSEAPYTRRQYESIFDLSFYRRRDLMDQSLGMIHLDENLNVILDQPVSLRDYFHVRLGLCSDLTMLTKEAQNRLRQNSCVFAKIIAAIAPFIDLSALLTTLNTCGVVSDTDWGNVVNQLNPNPLATDPAHRIGFNTVQSLFILAKDKEEVKA